MEAGQSAVQTTGADVAINVSAPRWYAPVVLTEEEAAAIRRMLDDPSAPASGGCRLPLLDAEAVERWRAARAE